MATETFYVVWSRDDVKVVGRVGRGVAEAIGPPKLEWLPTSVEFITDGTQITREEAEKYLADWGVKLPTTPVSGR